MADVKDYVPCQKLKAWKICVFSMKPDLEKPPPKNIQRSRNILLHLIKPWIGEKNHQRKFLNGFNYESAWGWGSKFML